MDCCPRVPSSCRDNSYIGSASCSDPRTTSDLPRCGTMWSTTVALTYFPCFAHSTHSGCASRYFRLAVLHRLPYPLSSRLRIAYRMKRLVNITVAFPHLHQCRTAWVLAGYPWFPWHGHHLRCSLIRPFILILDDTIFTWTKYLFFFPR